MLDCKDSWVVSDVRLMYSNISNNVKECDAQNIKHHIKQQKELENINLFLQEVLFIICK